MFVTNWISTTKIQKISEITNFFRHYFLSRTEVKILIISEISNYFVLTLLKDRDIKLIRVIIIKIICVKIHKNTSFLIIFYYLCRK